MRYEILGASGLRVSELALGTMTFGEAWGWGASRAESARIFEAYVEAGGNFVDTAINYTDGESEEFVGDFIAADRDRFVLATKYSLSTRKDDPNAGGNHRKNLVRSLEQSLVRLRTDHVDLLWLHMWDGTTPVEEVMRALEHVVRAGKALHVGVSDTPAWVVARANTIAALRGWTPFTALQIPYSLLRRDAERELFPMARALGIPVTPWGVLGGGVLTGKYAGAGGGARRYPDRTLDAREQAIVTEVLAVARELGATPSQVALRWAATRPDVAMLPIVGARSVTQLRELLESRVLELRPEHEARLEAASRIELGFPRAFLESDPIQNLVHGTVRDRIRVPASGEVRA